MSVVPTCAGAFALAAALLTLAVAPAARAQNCPASKTCFYVPPHMPPPPHAVSWDLVLAAASGSVSGTYTVAGQSAQPFTAIAGTPVVVPLPPTGGGVASAYATAEQRGVFVVADDPGLTVVHREINGPWNSSASIKDHNTALGARFRVGGYALDHVSDYASLIGDDVISIYAPLGATVTVTPPSGVPWGDGLPNGPQTISLSPQQTYVLRTLGSGCGWDLTGALVTADQPIAVVSGGRGWGSAACAPEGAAGGCGDDGLDNLIPTTGLGTLYAVDTYPASDGDRVTVVADSPDTGVSLNGTVVATLQPGEKYRFHGTGLTAIETSAPAYVFQDAGLSTCEHGMSIIPPLSFAPGAGTQTLAFNVYGSGEISVFLPTADVASLLVDGVAPSGSSATLPGYPDVTRVRVSLTGGDHTVSATADIQVGLVSAAGGTGLFAYYNRFRVPGCGDGSVAGDEACDDGGVLDGDGCSATCRFEIGSGPCTGDDDCVATGRCDDITQLCVARCNTTADCDDANDCTTDTCNTNSGVCEHSVTNAGQPCDDGQFCTANTVCDAAGSCQGGDIIGCTQPTDSCQEAVCDEPTNQCLDQVRSCESAPHYYFGVVSDGGDPPTYGSIRCWLTEGLVQCNTQDGELVVGPPVCE